MGASTSHLNYSSVLPYLYFRSLPFSTTRHSKRNIPTMFSHSIKLKTSIAFISENIAQHFKNSSISLACKTFSVNFSVDFIGKQREKVGGSPFFLSPFVWKMLFQRLRVLFLSLLAQEILSNYPTLSRATSLPMKNHKKIKFKFLTVIRKVFSPRFSVALTIAPFIFKKI